MSTRSKNPLLDKAAKQLTGNAVVDAMTDGVIVVSREGQIVLRNPAAARILADCSPTDIPAPLTSMTCEALRELLTQTLEARDEAAVPSKDVKLGAGTFMVSASPIRGAAGETLGATAVLRDITALAKLDAAKSMFVSMVAHEVRSPLAAVEGFLNTVLSSALGDDPERDRAMIKRAVIRVQTLRMMISELMSLRAMETGNFTLTRVPVDAKEIVAEAVQMYKWKAQDKGIQLKLDVEKAGPSAKVIGDKGALLSVFTNLIDNAVKYTPEDGHVSVTMECDGACVKIRVKDDGFGMSKGDTEKIFQEFYRVRNKYTAQIPGTGLGLTLVKRLLNWHQGKIDVSSVEGRGSEFTVCLPIAQQESS